MKGHGPWTRSTCPSALPRRPEGQALPASRSAALCVFITCDMLCAQSAAIHSKEDQTGGFRSISLQASARSFHVVENASDMIFQ